MKEFLDIVDENGQPTGEMIDRDTAHAKGVLHRTSHVWLARRKKGKVQILLQKRAKHKSSFPGCYDISSAGHIPAGCGFEESAIRELQEELGLTEADLDSLTLRYIVLRSANGEVRQNYFFFADLKAGAEDGLVSAEGQLGWFSPDELSALPMPPSARQAIDHWLAEGRYNTRLYGGISRADSAAFHPMDE